MQNLDQNIKKHKEETRVHKVDTNEFMTQYQNLCIYDVDHNNNNILEIIEYAPEIFKAIRMKCGVSEEQLFNSFAPIYNIQAIHNFFTGSGKS